MRIGALFMGTIVGGFHPSPGMVNVLGMMMFGHFSAECSKTIPHPQRTTAPQVQ
jgi:hypothetical protein